MRVLWLSHSADIGGAELALAEGVAALGARGHEVHVVLAREGPLRGRLNAAAGVHLEPSDRWAARRLTLRRALRWSAHNVLRAAPRIAALAQRLGADAIVTNTLTTPAGALAARRAGIRHIWFIHEYGLEDHQLRFILGFPLSLRVIGRLSSQVLVNSEAVRRHVCRWLPEPQVKVAHYAVDVEPEMGELGRAAGGFRLILVGAKVRAKGQADAIRALAIARKAGLDVSLELVGGGDLAYEAELRALCAELALGAEVAFVPFDPNPASRVAWSDVALMCSRSEAFGRVTIEAMKRGKPVIGAAAGATPELIQDGETGLLYSPGRPEELAARIEQLYRDRALARRMGERARAWANQWFNRERYGRDLEAVLLPEICREPE